MVVRRTIENLRERPKDEKTAIATAVALFVVAILLIGWLIYFFQSIKNTPAPDFQNAANPLNSNGLQQAQQQFQQAYGSTTQFIESARGNVQLEQVGTTTQPAQ